MVSRTAGLGCSGATKVMSGEEGGQSVKAAADGGHGVEVLPAVGGDQDDVPVGVGGGLRGGIGVAGIQRNGVEERVNDGVAGDGDVRGGEVLIEEVLPRRNTPLHSCGPFPENLRRPLSLVLWDPVIGVLVLGNSLNLRR